ncbi:MAG: HEAT repeat domain-containing protein [Planctomycetota bacterium]
MNKIKIAAAGLMLIAGAAGVVVAYMLVAANTIKKDVQALKGWEPSEGTRLENIDRDSKKLGQIRVVLKHKEKAVPHLVKAMETWPPSEAKGAMMALGLRRAIKGIPPIVAILRKEEGEAGYAAAAALSRYKDRAVAALKELWSGIADHAPPIRVHIYQAMAWSREKSLLETIAGGLEDPDESVAVAVANLLMKRRSKALVPPLLKALASPTEGISNGARESLVHNKKYVKAGNFKTALKSPKSHVRANALQVLGYLDRVRASETVEPFLEDKSPQVVAAAAEALSMMRSKFKMEKILPLLESDDPEVCKKACAVLKAQKAEAFLKEYTALLKHKHLHVRAAGASLLALGAKSQPGSLLKRDFIPILIELLQVKEIAETAGDTLDEAKNLSKTVKSWLDGETIFEEGKPEEAIRMLQKARDLYQEIIDKKLTRRGYDNEFVKLNSIERQVRSHLSD